MCIDDDSIIMIIIIRMVLMKMTNDLRNDSINIIIDPLLTSQDNDDGRL